MRAGDKEADCWSKMMAGLTGEAMGYCNGGRLTDKSKGTNAVYLSSNMVRVISSLSHFPEYKAFAAGVPCEGSRGETGSADVP